MEGTSTGSVDPAARSATADGVEVRPVRGRRELDWFIELPHRLRRDDPMWVPPLILERRRFLDRSKNPFFEHAEAEYFLARREGRPVGRVTAHIDRRWDQFQGGNDGMFGFFECEEDTNSTAALMEAAAGWLRDRGRERMLGPMNFTTNDECGVLIEGFDDRPIILQPWNPPYYQRLLEGFGMTKAMDLLMWHLAMGELKQGDQFHQFIHRAAEQAKTEHRVVLRSMRKRDLEEEVSRFMEIYNEAWGGNWGFVPVTEEEVRHQAKSLKPILSEDWAMIAEREGEVVGAALTLPDINRVLAKMNGRLLPFGWWHFFRRRRIIDRVRVFALGVKPQYQHMGVAAALYVRHLEMVPVTGIDHGETGWILETNEAMNRAMEGMGGKIVKRYRLYELPLG